MNVISAFDGISCGKVALDRLGAKVDKYFAFEIDKYAIKISEKNHPNNIRRLGSIKDWRFFSELPKIDLLLAGFPCQSHSIAGNRQGLHDPRGDLLYDLLDMIEFYKPTNLLLENVKGFLTSNKGEAHKMLLSTLKSFGYDIHFDVVNSALVSAQNRERVYYTSWKFEKPKDRGILLKDIVLSDVEPVALHNLYGGFNESAVRVFEDKSPTLRTAAGGGHIPSFVKKDLIHSQKAIEYMDRPIADGRTHWDFGYIHDVRDDKSKCLVANLFKGIPYNVFKDWDCIRKFDPIECERLQTLPDNYTEGVSNTQRYKMLGNGWNVETIVEILKQM